MTCACTMYMYSPVNVGCLFVSRSRRLKRSLGRNRYIIYMNLTCTVCIRESVDSLCRDDADMICHHTYEKLTTALTLHLLAFLHVGS